MRDLAVPTLATAATLFAVYAAGLIFIAQHVADRYTPLLYPVVVRRTGSVWLGLLSLVVVASLALTLIKVEFWTNITDALLLVVTLLLTVAGIYKTFRDTANRSRILKMIGYVGDRHRITALRDLTWSSVSRGDVTSTEFLLNFAPYSSQQQVELANWITQYSQLLEQSWLRQAILASLTAGKFDNRAAKLLGPALIRLFVCILDREWYDSLNDTILAMVRAVVDSAEFGEYQRYVVFDFGFNLHYIGEERSATPCVSERSPQSLNDARDFYLSKLTILREAILRYNDPASLTQFCVLLESLAESHIGVMHVSSQVWEVLEEGYKQGIIEQRALESLCNMIGHCRFGDEDYPDLIDPQEELDELAAHVALYIVALGYGGQLDRMMGNARFGGSKRMPRRLAMSNADVSEEIYSTVAKRLGQKSWPKSHGRPAFKRGRR